MQTTDMRRRFTREFKLGVVKQIELGLKTKAQTCREHDLAPSMLDRWCERVKAKGDDAFKDQVVKEPNPDQRIKELEASLGRAHLEIEFMREALSILRNPERKSP